MHLVDERIIELLRVKREMQTDKITEAVIKALPKTTAGNVKKRLGILKKKGVIAMPVKSFYRLAGTETTDTAGTAGGSYSLSNLRDATSLRLMLTAQADIKRVSTL